MARAIPIRAVLALAFSMLGAASASADALFSPWVGFVRGDQPVEGRRAFGWTAGGMHRGAVGGEVDFGFSPNFFGEPIKNSALTVMGNLIIGIPVGGTAGIGLRPYVTGGAGLIRTQIDTPSGRDDASNTVGINAGGGLMGFFSDHFGVRTDLRYFREVTRDGQSSSLGSLVVDGGRLDFWRGTIGIVIR